MRTSPPSLLTLFRSQAELELLGELFVGSGRPRSVSTLARSVRVPVPTAARELARLEEAGIVVTRTEGRNKLVQANWDLPWALDLARLLDKTIGPRSLLAEALRGVRGIEEAWIFGSWAARYSGEPGQAVHDIDVVLVGDDIDVLAATTAADDVSERVGLEVTPIYVKPKDWNDPGSGSFLARLRDRPLVQLDLGDVDG
ncbi:MAG TPA: helix-turn-helix domain-containing protein [Acidimicrobiales bacterium]|nr:helix-turn-helix domain-containing protein [Acidimicrobiales bacterium]